MLKTKLLHPEIYQALGSAGHGSKILIADGNYPFSTASAATARKVYLNLMPGVVKVTEVLEALVATVPIEAATVMVPADGARQAIFEEFKGLLPDGLIMKEVRNGEFYELARTQNTALVIATGEQRRFANLLLTIGVIKKEQ